MESSRWYSRATAAVVLSTALAVVLVGAACGGSDNKNADATSTAAAVSTADKKAIETHVQSSIDKFDAKDATGFVDGWTTKGLSELFQMPEADVTAFVSSPDFAQAVGDPQLIITGFSNTTITGNTATTEVHMDGGSGVAQIDKFTLTKEGAGWKISGHDGFAVAPEVPAGYTSLEMKIQEFAFGVDTSKIVAGKMNFDVENVGKQVHEVAIAKLGDGVDLQTALASGSDRPEGIELVGRIELKPGRSTNMVLNDALEPGRYAFVCIMPDTEGDGAPHAMKGMVTEFTVK